MSAQLFFLLQRYAQQGELAQGDLFSRGGIVTDYVFAKDRLFAIAEPVDDELVLYDRIYQMLKVRTVDARSGRVPAGAHRGAGRTHPPARASRGEADPRRIRRRGGAGLTREFFFAYNEGPLLIVNASDIDFVGNAEHRRELLAVIDKARAGTQPLEPRLTSSFARKKPRNG